MNGSANAPAPARFDRLIRHVVVSAIVAALAYLGFSVFVGWREVVEAIARVGAAGLTLALLLSVLNYGLRFLRWQGYLRTLGHPVEPGPSVLIYLAGFAFTTTPGKAGELLRGIFLHRRGLPYGTSAAAFLSERVSDLLAVLLLCLPGVALLPARLAMGAGVVILCGLTLAVGLARSSLPARALAWCARAGTRRAHWLTRALPLLADAARCHRPRVFATATVLSLLAWSAEALAFALVLHLLGVAVSVPIAVFIYAASMIAGALSFLPGGLGGAEATMIGLLAIAGAPYPESVAATILIRLTTLWFAVALGIALTVAGRRTLFAPAASRA